MMTDDDMTHIMIRAREILSDESKWTHGPRARDANGKYVGESSSDAVCWSLKGAVWKAIEELCGSGYDIDTYSKRMKMVLGAKCIIGKVVRRDCKYDYDVMTYWDDEPDRTYDDVIKVLSEAVSDCKGEGDVR